MGKVLHDLALVLVYQVRDKKTMKGFKTLVVILLVLHAMLSVLQGFDVLSTIDLIITILLAYFVMSYD